MKKNFVCRIQFEIQIKSDREMKKKFTARRDEFSFFQKKTNECLTKIS